MNHGTVFVPSRTQANIEDGGKICAGCGEWKPWGEFYKCRRNHDGHGSRCKECFDRYASVRHGDVNDYQRAYRAAHADTSRRYAAAYYRAHSEGIKARVKAYRRSHAPDLMRKALIQQAQRRATDPMFRLRTNMRTRLGTALRAKRLRKGSSTERILGCSWPQLRAHLETQFTSGMTWANYGEWHVDHIVPLASARTVEELERLGRYTNLQPLWAVDNIRKGDHMPDEWAKAHPLAAREGRSKRASIRPQPAAAGNGEGDGDEA